MEKEVKFKSGRTITVGEISALEDTLAYRMAGKDFEEDNKFAGSVIFQAAQTALSIKKVDGVEVKRPRNTEELFAFMAGFSKKEWSKVQDAYMEINIGDSEDDEQGE